MPRLREARIPTGRKYYTIFLKICNLAVIILGIMTVVMSFEINPKPTFSPGWLLILLGAITMLGGFTGFGGTTLPCCYKSHIIFMSITIFGTFIFCLVLFGQRPKVVASFKSTRFSEAMADEYLSSISWVYVLVVIVEGIALLARIYYQRSIAAQAQFETLTQTQDFRNTSLGKMRQDIGGHGDVVDRTRAGNLDMKMQDKYAKFAVQVSKSQLVEALSTIMGHNVRFKFQDGVMKT